jgi:hypothetical protein
MSLQIFSKHFSIRKFKIRFLKSLKPGVRCQNLTFLQNTLFRSIQLENHFSKLNQRSVVLRGQAVEQGIYYIITDIQAHTEKLCSYSEDK